LRDLATHRNFKVANLRYFNPIGAHSSGLIWEDPNDIPNNLLPYIMKVASGKLKELSVYGDDYNTIDGTWVRDYIHVVDLADAHQKAWHWLEKQNNIIFESFNIWTWSGTSVLEMIELTQQIIWKALPHKIVGRRSWDIASAYCSPKKAKDILWWESKYWVKQAISDSWDFIQKSK
jgi:UDP-glucose 4-epimerase